MEQIDVIMSKMPGYLKQLITCEPIVANQIKAPPKPKDKGGVYALYEDGEALYVGRSDHILRRLRQHVNPRVGSPASPLARKIAGISTTAGHTEDFKLAKEKVGRMEARMVEITECVEQAIFEVYAHVALGYTRYNEKEFCNH